MVINVSLLLGYTPVYYIKNSACSIPANGFTEASPEWLSAFSYWCISMKGYVILY